MDRQFLRNFTVVIPVYNEESAIEKTLRDLAAHVPEFTIVVVNDGSTDGTAKALASIPGITVVRHKKNKGYGAALKTGIRSAATDYVMTYDSDGQHRPEDAVAIAQFIKERDLDLAVGARGSDSYQVPIRRPGKWLLTKVANHLARTKIPDLNSGLRAFRRSAILRYLHIMPDGFSFSTTSTLAMFNGGYMVEYHPINVTKRIGKSTVRLQDGLDTLMLIIRIMVLFQPLRFFTPISIVFITLGGTKGFLWDWVYRSGGVTTSSLLVFLTGVLIFCLGVLSDQISSLRIQVGAGDIPVPE